MSASDFVSLTLCVCVSLYVTLSSLLLMNGSWLIGGVFCEGIFGVMLLAGPLSPCWVRVGEIRSSVWKEVLMIKIKKHNDHHHNNNIDQKHHDHNNDFDQILLDWIPCRRKYNRHPHFPLGCCQGSSWITWSWSWWWWRWRWWRWWRRYWWRWWPWGSCWSSWRRPASWGSGWCSRAGEFNHFDVMSFVIAMMMMMMIGLTWRWWWRWPGLDWNSFRPIVLKS